MGKVSIFILLLLVVASMSAQQADTFFVSKQRSKSSFQTHTKNDIADKIPTPNFNRVNSVKTDFLFSNPHFNQRQLDTVSLENVVEKIQSRLYSFLPQSRSGSNIKVELRLELLSASKRQEFTLQTLKLPEDVCKHIKSLEFGDRVIITKLQFTSYSNSLEVVNLLVPYIIFLL